MSPIPLLNMHSMPAPATPGPSFLMATVFNSGFNSGSSSSLAANSCCIHCQQMELRLVALEARMAAIDQTFGLAQISGSSTQFFGNVISDGGHGDGYNGGIGEADDL